MARRLVFVVAFCVFLSVGIVAARGVVGARVGVDAVRLVRVLKSRIKGFNGSKPTLVFFASSSQCLGCGSSAINWVVRRGASVGLDVNQVLVVRVSVRGDGLGLRGVFLVKNIVEDLDGSILSLADVEDKPGITLVAVGSDGHVLLVLHDLQRGLDGVGMFVDSLSQKPGGYHKLQLRTMRMARGVSVIEAASPRYVSDGGAFKFVETAQNRICRVDLRTAVVSYADTCPAELWFYFWTVPETDTVRKAMLANYSPLARMEGLLSCSGDTTAFIGYLFTGYEMVDVPNGRRRANFQSADARVVTVGSKLVSASLLPHSRYLLQQPLVQLDNGTWVGPCVWESYYGDTSVAGKYPDSLRLLARFGNEFRSSSPFLVLADLERAYGRKMFGLYVPAFARLGRSELFYLDAGNRVMIRLHDSLGAMVFSKLETGGVLGRLLAGNYVQSADTDVTVVGTASRDGGVNVVMYVRVNGKHPHRVVVARFDERGTYVGEERFDMFTLSSRDEYVGSVLVGADSDGLRFMLRMKSAGWLLGTLR
ncbi:MAG TPA: hypothetical protein VHI13_21425 [Candidatus Kapabacteria bacterium]|nr:hypothetical protein [Candidatus Kapabacteria bacterium]